MKPEEALKEIRKSEERNFNQSIDLIVNLKKFDVKKTSINTFITIPYKIREKKLFGFIDLKSDLIETIPKNNFQLYKDKKKIKNLLKKYDFFISSMVNMPSVATTFGRLLGPSGKMPSPKMGIITNEDEKSIKEVIEKINKSIKVQTKEPSIKVVIGVEKMPDNEIIENIKQFYSTLIHELPLGKDNIKNVMIKLTMCKPVKVEIWNGCWKK